MKYNKMDFSCWEKIIIILMDYEVLRNEILFRAQIAKKIDFTRHYVCVIIKELEKKKVLFVKEGKDKRYGFVYLTPKGKKVGEILIKLREAFNK